MKQLTTIRIMIIDDHPVVRAGLASMLSTQPDIDVVASASSGQEALVLLDTITPDVILMDLRMPGMSGLEAMRLINSRLDPPRIIVLTSFDTDEDIYQSVGAGAHGYILKDAPQDRLLEAIKVVNTKGRYFPADIASRLTERMARSNLTPVNIRYCNSSPRVSPTRKSAGLSASVTTPLAIMSTASSRSWKSRIAPKPQPLQCGKGWFPCERTARTSE